MVLVIATAGLVYELCIAAVASYVLGDSVTQFSTVIGVYLSALGLGAWLSRFVDRNLERVFVDVELGTAVVGALSAPGLFLAFGFTGAFRLVLYSVVVLVGVLVGLELPLLMRILRRELEFKELVARALTFDYAGALIGSLAFSLILVPRLGLIQTSIVSGLVNALVGLASTWLLRAPGAPPGAMDAPRARAVVVTLALFVLLAVSGRVTALTEAQLYPGRIFHAEQSAYQRIVLSERGAGFELFLNGNLQFSSLDEHRYHEALVHPAMGAAARRARVLIGGGGDGLAAREALRWPEVEALTLVDLDPAMTRLATSDQRLRRQNQGSLTDPRVRVVNADAMTWFASSTERFDVIILDFPDPTNYSLGKLYSSRFYASARERLADDGALVVQSTNPELARRAYWCIAHTLEAAGLTLRPYHVFLPSFGDWGFLLAKRRAFPVPTALPPAPLRYLDRRTLPALFELPPDLAELPTRANRLDNQALVAYYLAAWARFD